jgi:Fe-S-cluster containining protein
VSRKDSLEAIYAEVPSIPCRGLCHTYCGPVDGAAEERRRIAARGFTIDPRSQLTMTPSSVQITMCPALTPFGSCAVYSDRPLICRLWGVTESMPCEYGCKPERLLTNDEARDLIMRSIDVGGLPLTGQPREPAE